MSEAGGVRLTFLGTGTSHGIPMIGCDCAVCTSSDARDQRSRCSVYVEWQGCRLLVDTPPELRLQCVANDIRVVDAVLYTHAHADHVTGIDDLRRFNWLSGGELNAYGLPETLKTLHRMFAYVFDDDPDYPSHKPSLKLCPIGERAFHAGSGCSTTEDAHGGAASGAVVQPIQLFHGDLPVLGFRFGNVAYCTDCNRIPPESMRLLQDLDVLVLDGLRHRPHPTHFNLEEAIAAARVIGARRTFFTHIAHELGHAETCAGLPDGMTLAYDGLVIASGQA